MQLSDFDFDLPEESIALRPNPSRSLSRLLLLDKESGTVAHGTFTDICAHLNPGDLLLLNDTRVIPARLKGKKPTGGAVELLLTEKISGDKMGEGERAQARSGAIEEQWRCIGKPAKGLGVGATVLFDHGVTATVTAVATDGAREILFAGLPEGVSAPVLLGEIPLPPYINRAVEAKDTEQYQTVYAKHDGAVAAPTAGLHFTQELLEEIAVKGVTIKYITLHVGPGTFLPVRVDNVEEHSMQRERYSIGADVVEAILKTKQAGGRVVAVGTTTTRAIEGAWRSLEKSKEGEDGAWRTLKEPSGSGIFEKGGAPCALDGATDIFIYPGFEFQVVDALITNFHLPRSTLIMLVSAMAGKDNILHAYGEAVKEGYRFYSYGDAMFIE
ncbi:MAG: tRNA preQ1(34) S-adenosylmethionine ribosyltransferase-isomerase QueA [Proteobacteria bacterium]|nr:tRNA preQ1(34) S-adenosylmethionine ribosyltransferase-isomerase QueA [Pseudomonadota bacterium]